MGGVNVVKIFKKKGGDIQGKNERSSAHIGELNGNRDGSKERGGKFKTPRRRIRPGEDPVGNTASGPRDDRLPEFQTRWEGRGGAKTPDSVRGS